MRNEETVTHETSSPILPQLAQSLQIIHEFLDSFPAGEMQARCLELIQCAFSSDEAANWSSIERSNMVFFYEKMCHLAPALTLVDKELAPMHMNGSRLQ